MKINGDCKFANELEVSDVCLQWVANKRSLKGLSPMVKTKLANFTLYYTKLTWNIMYNSASFIYIDKPE